MFSVYNLLKTVYYNLHFWYSNNPDCFGEELHILGKNANLKNVKIYTKHKKVHMGFSFNGEIDGLEFCEGIEIIDFGFEFNKSLDNIKFPKSLKKIVFGCSFNKSLLNVKFPENFEEIEFWQNPNLIPINSIPNGIKVLTIKENITEINNLPMTLEKSQIAWRYNKNISIKIPFGCRIYSTNKYHFGDITHIFN